MKKALLALLLLVGACWIPLGAQGSLSEQVLRLLTRNNSWTGVNTFASTVGLTLASGGAPPTGGTTSRLYNLGGSLYWNGTLVGVGGGGVGTVTSVGLSLPGFFTVTNSPVTGAGTLTATLASQGGNLVLASPTGGGGTPAFRALLAADIPSLSATYLTASNSATLTNKSGAISQWTNDSNYLTTGTTSMSGLDTVGTITTGVWHGTLLDGQYGGTGANNVGKTIILGGNLSTGGVVAVSGVSDLTLTVTAPTSVTLPTSGTVATTAATTLSSLVSIGTITTGVWHGTVLGAAYGGTGLTSYTTGDLLYASGATTVAGLADVATGNVLKSGGVSTAPSWGKLDLTAAVTGTLPAANGGTSITSTPTNGQTLIGNGSGYTLATLTGTANQVIVNNGVGTITLSAPQSLNTTATPQFLRMGLGGGPGSVEVLKLYGQVNAGLTDDGTCAATDTIDWTSGNRHKSTITGATCTYTFTNPVLGTYVLLVTQDGTGGRFAAWPGAVKWKGGAAPTLTAGATKIDVCTFEYDGTNYLGQCDLNY